MRLPDSVDRFFLQVRLFFTRDPRKRKELLVCIALATVEDRKALADAMLGHTRYVLNGR